MNKSQLVAHFEAIGFHPKHRLGQNFLIDPNLARKLVDLADLATDQTVVEIGPGMGMITREILQREVQLTVVERDPELRDYLDSTIGLEFSDRFQMVYGDAVDLPLGGISEPNRCSVIANPPFSITGPWLAKILDIGLPKSFSLLLQKEAVERITAVAGTKHFGTLAMRLAASYECVQTHSVPPQCFYPAPKIDSMIVGFRRRENPYVFKSDTLKLVHTLFTQRRKQIGGRVRKLLPESTCVAWEQILVDSGLNFQARPEQIPTEVWIQLDAAIDQA